MLAATHPITAWHWTGFVVAVLFFLALDLGVFHRKAHIIRFKEAMLWTLLWFTLAMLFAMEFIRPRFGDDLSLSFVTAYITELSLSMDNVLVIGLIFSYFRVPTEYQHRVLFWGVLGVLVMRGLMIWAGAALISRFEWTLYFFGFFLLFTGWQTMRSGGPEVNPDHHPLIRAARRFFPVTTELDGSRFTTRVNGRLALTPLALVLGMVETTDLLFAVDSIPAVFGLTTNAFIVFTSNVLAILGLRSLYFVLERMIGYFRFLKTGLAVVLMFIGVKMLIDPHAPEAGPAKEPLWFQMEIPGHISLLAVAGIIALSIVVSLLHTWFARRPSPE